MTLCDDIGILFLEYLVNSSQPTAHQWTWLDSATTLGATERNESNVYVLCTTITSMFWKNTTINDYELSK